MSLYCEMRIGTELVGVIEITNDAEGATSWAPDRNEGRADYDVSWLDWKTRTRQQARVEHFDRSEGPRTLLACALLALNVGAPA